MKATLGFVCDVAALWLQRGGAVDVLLGTVPLLVKAMAACPEDVSGLAGEPNRSLRRCCYSMAAACYGPSPAKATRGQRPSVSLPWWL